jgi:hypothetical protein
MKIENISILFTGGGPCKAAKGYNVELFEQKIARLTGIISESAASSIENIELLIALEPDSEY